MASHDLVSRIQEERRAEAAETRLGQAAATTEPSAIARVRLSAGLWLIAAGQALAGTPARGRAAWVAPGGAALNARARRP
jgi:hypothetical protein